MPSTHAHHRLGHHSEAVAWYQQALEMYGEVGSDDCPVAMTLDHIGDNHYAAGDLQAAITAWKQAAVIFEATGNLEAEQVQAGTWAVKTGGRSSGANGLAYGPPLAQPFEFGPGKVLVYLMPAVSDDDAKTKFPKGWKALKPYLRVTPQPNR